MVRTNNGKITVLADGYGGNLNAPNDAVVHPDAIWFTDRLRQPDGP